MSLSCPNARIGLWALSNWVVGYEHCCVAHETKVAAFLPAGMAGGAVAGALACPLYGDHASWLDPLFPWGDKHHDKNTSSVGHATHSAAFISLATHFGLLQKLGALFAVAMLKRMQKSDEVG